jgi:hypothetical protein
MGSNSFAIILTFVHTSHTFNDKSQKTAANAKHIIETRCKWLNSQNYYIPKICVQGLYPQSREQMGKCKRTETIIVTRLLQKKC